MSHCRIEGRLLAALGEEAGAVGGGLDLMRDGDAEVSLRGGLFGCAFDDDLRDGADKVGQILDDTFDGGLVDGRRRGERSVFRLGAAHRSFLERRHDWKRGR